MKQIWFVDAYVPNVGVWWKDFYTAQTSLSAKWETNNNLADNNTYNNESNRNIKRTHSIPLADGRGPVSATDVAIMYVSPTTHLNDTGTVDDNKENSEVQLHQTPFLSSVTNPNQPVNQLTEAITPSLTPNQPNATKVKHQSAAPHPATLLDEENRDTKFTYVLRKYTTIVENLVYSPLHFRWIQVASANVS